MTERKTKPKRTTAHHGLTPEGNLDFSRGGPAEGTVPADDRAGLINRLIDQALEEKARRDIPRTYLGGSRLGMECTRALAYERFEAQETALLMRDGRPNPKMRFKGKILRVFRDGHRIEDQCIDDLRGAGFQVDDRDPSTGRQWAWHAGNGQIKGHLDGIVTGGPDVGVAFPCLLEIKSMNDKKWNLCRDKGVKVSHPIYYAQMQVYMAYMGLHANPAWFYYYNKNTSEYGHEFVPFDLEAAQKASDAGVRVIEAKSPDDIPRLGSSIDDFRCKWCDFKERCWAPEPQSGPPAIFAKPDWL